MSENTTVDLFAGCGGMSTGFGQAPAPFRVVVANEMDRAAAETYRRNHPGVPVVEGDITRPEVKDAVVAAGAGADVVAGGVPCPPWSRAGKRKGFADPRGRLWFDFVEVVSRIRPKVFMAENVPGMLDFPDALAELDARFAAAGYRVLRRVLNSVSFGVAQKRQRLIWVGVRADWDGQLFAWPEPSHMAVPGELDMRKVDTMMSFCRQFPAWRTAWAAIAPYASMPDDPSINHVRPRHKPAMVAKIANTPQGSGVYPKRRSGWFRIRADRPAPTVMHNNGIGFIHPFDARASTVRELAAVQGFADDFVFTGSKVRQFLQAANAVPPPMGAALAEAVGAALEPLLDPKEFLAQVASPALRGEFRGRMARWLSTGLGWDGADDGGLGAAAAHRWLKRTENGGAVCPASEIQKPGYL